MYTEIYQKIEDLKSRTANGSISPDELFTLVNDLTVKVESVDLASGGFTIKKIYASKTAMNADTAALDADGRTIRVGQLVSIFNAANENDADNGKIYRRIAGGWQYTGNIVKFTTDRVTDGAITTPKIAEQAVVRSKLDLATQSDITNSLKSIKADANTISYDITTNCTKTNSVGVVHTSGTTNTTTVFDSYSGLCKGSRLQVRMPISTNSATSYGIAFFDENGAYLYGYKLNYAVAYATETITFWLSTAVRSFKTTFFKDTATYGDFNAVLLIDDHETLTLDQREVSYGHGININAEGVTLGALYASTIIGSTDYIRCDNVSQIKITVPVLTTASSQGIVFFDSGNVPISGILRPVGAVRGIQEITISRPQIPMNAYSFRSCAWNFDNSLLYGSFSCTLTYIKGTLGNGKYLPIRSGYIHFSVKVNQSVSNSWDTGSTNQEPVNYKASTAVMVLPDGYTQWGAKTKAMFFFHGMNNVVTDVTWGSPGADSEGANEVKLAQKEFFRASGFAVIDCNGPYDNGGQPVYGIGSPQAVEAYRKCYEYIIERYNIDPEIYAIGGSMGGVVALNYCFSYQHVRALALLSPWTDLKNVGWPSLSASQKSAFVDFYGFADTSTFDDSKVKGHNPAGRIREINGVQQINYNKHPIKMWIGSLENTQGSLLYPNALAFINALINGDSNARLRIVEGADHTLVSGGSDVVNQEVVTWLKKY